MFRAGTWPVCLLGFAIVSAVGGCSAGARRSAYLTVQSELIRNRTEARHCNDRGLAAAQLGNMGEAEKLFREALKHDLTYPAAHNNLGLVLFSQRRYYEAAWEFSYATKLDASAVEPWGNLARLYESLGWMKEAHSAYRHMAEMAPENPVAIAGLTRTGGRQRGAAHDAIPPQNGEDNKWVSGDDYGRCSPYE